ncbi:LuxR C-terminal-related transcriptional regulator [Streptomyces sp. NBC_01538]|jgi:DNA-binding NarL/FixJ family response regulator|uniref:LuxR C-terminal-related transcriptional regulator n=1 Tax=Streptomyces sp. NBC_01538 TaxID=2903897 RepID=UPI003863971A
MLQTLASNSPRRLLVSVVAEGKRAQAAALVRTTRPDILISGDTCGKDSLSLMETIARLSTPPAALVITERITERDTRSLLTRGAAGVLLHRSAPQHLSWALTAVTKGSRALSPEIANAIIGGYRAPTHSSHGSQERIASLSTREREVLTLLSDGLPNRGIAQALHISPETVKTHISTVCVKLRARNRIHAARIAWQADLASPPT